ncbi:small GTPase superfamily [Sparassis latifolia]
MDGFLLVYSITSRDSFEHIKAYHDSIVHDRGEQSFPLALFGNQCEMEFLREVSKAKGQAPADSLKCSFAETSAKMGVNVEHPFYGLIGDMVSYYKTKKN